METQKIEIAPKSIFIFILSVVAVYFLFVIGDILMILFIAIIIASAFDPWVSFLQKKRIPRIVSVVLIYAIFILLLATIFYFIMPTMIRAFQSFNDYFTGKLLSQFDYIKDSESFAMFDSKDILSKLPQYFTGGQGGSAFNFLFGVFGGLISGVSIFVISLYLLMRERGIERFLRYITPMKNESYVINLWIRVQKKLSSWLRGQLFLGLAIGVLTFIGLSVLQVKHAFILAFLATIFELVPYVGPVLSVIPAAIIGFSQTLFLGVAVVILYIFIQQTENHLIVPLVMKKVTGLNPVVVIISLLMGAKFGGLIGVVVSVPLATVVVEIFSDFVEKKPMEEAV